MPRYARSGPSDARLARKTATPPTVAAIGPAPATAMLLMPMYRPDSALGMMSVISAQSTPRKTPLQMPIGTAAATTIQYAGAVAMTAAPTMPSPMATYSTGLRPIRDEIQPPGTALSRAAAATVRISGNWAVCASSGSMPWAFSRKKTAKACSETSAVSTNRRLTSSQT